MEIEQQVRQALETYRSAVRTKSVEHFMHLYDADVRIFDTWATWSYEGAAAWRGVVEGWFSSLGRETVEVTFDDVRITGGRDFAGASAIVTYAAISAEGQQVRAMQNRISWVVRVTGDGLKVVHEHTSAPLRFEDGKGVLAREGSTSPT